MINLSRYFRSALLPWLVLAVCLAAVYLQWRSEQKLIVRQTELRFANACDHMTATLKRRMQRYDLLLQGCKGLFSASDVVNRDEFHTYCASLNIKEYSPGVLAVGFCRHVPAGELETYINRQRLDGDAGFSVFPAGARSSYCPVEFIEPFTGVNTRVRGYDVCSETVRLAAFEQARDLDATVLTDRIMLVQFADADPQPGLLLVAPIYAGHGSPGTPAERRENLFGYVYAAFRVADYIEAALARLPSDIQLEIYDEQGPVPGALLYRSPNAGSEVRGAVPASLATQFTLEHFNRQWTVRFSALSFFTAGFSTTRQTVITVSGIFIGLLLWFGTMLVVAGNKRLARDIKERKLAADEIRRASQKWRATFDAMLDAVALLDLDATILQCNRAFADFVGLRFEDIIGRKCCTLVHATDAPPPECPALRTRTSRMRASWETCIGEKYIFIITDPVFDDDGSLVSIVHIIQDITWRRQAEQEVRRKNDDLASILDAVPAFVMVGHDPECRRITGNRYMYEHLGIAAGTNISQTAAARGEALDLAHFRPDGTRYLPEELPMQRAIAAGKQIINEEFEYVFPNGRRCFVVGNAVPLFDESGRPRGSVAVFFDITALKKAQEALHSYAARQNALLGAIPDIVMEVDSHKIYTWANRPGIEFFGNDVLGREASYYFEGEQDTYQQVQRLFEGDETTVYVESWQRRRDGEKRLLGWWCHVIRDADGLVWGALATARDITDWKRMEEALRAKNRELENFVYTVSHDLKSPLITIRTYLGHLVQDIAKGDTGRIRQDVDFINNASHTMNSMLEELLQLSRIGRVTNTVVMTPLQDIVQEALVIVAGQIKQRGVRVNVCDDTVQVFGDRPRLVQVLQNLIDNAVKYMGDQQNPSINIGAEQRNGEVVVYVRDNGRGLEHGCETKLFQIFERLDSREEGAGIGLALVKRIIEVHGGRVWAESDGPGTGACFYFALPVHSMESGAGSGKPLQFGVMRSEKD